MDSDDPNTDSLQSLPSPSSTPPSSPQSPAKDHEYNRDAKRKKRKGRPTRPARSIVPFVRTKLGSDSLKVATIPFEDVGKMNKLFKSLIGTYVKDGIYYINGVPHKIRATVFIKGLRKWLTLHKFLGGNAKGYNRIDYAYYKESPLERLTVFKPMHIQLVKLRGKTANIQRLWSSDNPVMPPISLTRDLQEDEWTWVTSIKPAQKCPKCGICWTQAHTCKQSNSAFYWMSIEKSGRELWQHVKFKTASSPPNTKLLFVTYDIETYTMYVNRGKRMLPFMLCFRLSGDKDMVAKAFSLACDMDGITQFNGGFYWMDPRPGVVGKRFREFRTRLQILFADDMINRLYLYNQAYIDALLTECNLKKPRDIPYEKYCEGRKNLKLPDDFYQVSIIVVGHNICRFDEILLSSEIMDAKEDYPKATKCERAFMPRAGRLLFNDIYFSLPNPIYAEKDPSRADRWKEGINTMSDYVHLSVKFTVRDTCQLTGGANLRKAAQAYSLDASKGECPYEAINTFISAGYYNMDEEGFPALEYWQSPQVMREQKELWFSRHPGWPYDIMQACLEYCMLDVVVTEQLAFTILHNYDVYFKKELGFIGDFNIFERPTIPSNTHALWKQLAFKEYSSRRSVNHDPASTSQRKPRLDPRYVAQLYSPHRLMFKYIRQALRGGRCYPTHFGPFYEPVFVFDICGMYASALTHPLPHGPPLDPKFTADHVDRLNDILAKSGTISYFDPRIKPSILKVEAHPPPIEDLDPLPPICSRRGGRLVWTNESLHDEVITVIDIITLHNRGWTVKVLHDPMNVVFKEWRTICAEYVGKNIRAKEKADREGNEIMRSISKLLSNALYGAFATNMDTTKVVFEQDLTKDDLEKIQFGELEVNHVTILNDPSFGGYTIESINSLFQQNYLQQHFNPPLSEQDLCDDELPSKDENQLTESPSLEDFDEELQDLNSGAYIPADTDHAHFASANTTEFKPLTLMDAPAEAVTVLHLERSDQLVENNRYATQLACFVLGWSRAFFSEWAEIIHGPDRGIHPHDRPMRSLYGDTDSIFLTASGYERMLTRGAHRIKSKDTKLIFDPDEPQLTWACECDIKCKLCKADTFSSESIFLAPKLYALKDARCTQCGHVGIGKLRAKGHPGEELVYDTLLRCWQRSEEERLTGKTTTPELSTSREIFKKTLLNKVSRYEPFTLHNEKLTRVLRPWKDMTLYPVGSTLHPYNNANPNPRNEKEVRLVEDFSNDDPMAPLKNAHGVIDPAWRIYRGWRPTNAENYAEEDEAGDEEEDEDSSSGSSSDESEGEADNSQDPLDTIDPTDLINMIDLDPLTEISAEDCADLLRFLESDNHEWSI
ncbi:DNA polymerase [Duck adenovirus 2]|nr:DNA polymerase [Duck adenovirus 2]